MFDKIYFLIFILVDEFCNNNLLDNLTKYNNFIRLLIIIEFYEIVKSKYKRC